MVRVEANENGLARVPPMGWRSWNLFGGAVDQSLIQRVMEGMVSRTRVVDGVPTSLCDLGYCDVGLDDNWQLCGDYGGHTYHDATGAPVVNAAKFPSLWNLTAHAHELGLTAGFYGNNCICQDQTTGDRKFYEGDVDALLDFGFDSWKLDGCGAQLDLQLFDDLIRAKSPNKPIMVENCHWGTEEPYEPTATWCPWNFYRTSRDVRATYASVLFNLASTQKYAEQNLSTPGCWAYPDMLEVGCAHGPGGAQDPGLSAAETRTHFYAWAIISSPLTLSHDVHDETIADAIWEVIANKEAIAVNQVWAGHSGSRFKSSLFQNETLVDDVHGEFKTWTYQYLYKPLGDSKVAVLLANSGMLTGDLVLQFVDVPSLQCDTAVEVRDIANHAELGVFDISFVAKSVLSHDVAFLVLSC